MAIVAETVQSYTLTLGKTTVTFRPLSDGNVIVTRQNRWVNQCAIMEVEKARALYRQFVRDGYERLCRWLSLNGRTVSTCLFWLRGCRYPILGFMIWSYWRMDRKLTASAYMRQKSEGVAMPTNLIPQTVMANEVTIVVLPPEYAHLSASGQLCSDELPKPEVPMGKMEILDQPEPIPDSLKRQ